ncbi:MAG: hypothetical protein ABL907_24320 [Hyphomicrobium sp.]
MTAAEPIVRPLEMKIEPKTRFDQQRLLDALPQLANFDPTFGFSVDDESGEIILQGQSELHLDLKTYHLIGELGIAVQVGPPQICYRETITRPATCDYTHSPNNTFARVELRVAPRSRDAGNVFESEFRDAPEIAAYASGVEKGVRSILANGVLIGFPLADVCVTWTNGSFDTVRSNPVAFEIAARFALKAAFDKAQIVLLEPIMKVEIETPVDFLSRVLTDIDGRRGKIISQEMRGEGTLIEAHIPLATMFGYIRGLHSLTKGVGTYAMSYSHYDFVPRNIANGPDQFPPAMGMRA